MSIEQGEGRQNPSPSFHPFSVDCRAFLPAAICGISTNDYTKILCPFHEEHTPSCAVYSDRYYCYGCGANGRSVSLYMQLNRLDRDQAITQLEQANFPKANSVPKRVKLPKQTLAAELHFNLTDEAMEYYIYKRGLYPQTIQDYQLGWGSLYPESPSGYTIPIYHNQKLRQIKLRLPNADKDKYRSVGGAGAWLYLGEDISYQDRVFLAGGEFDALVLRQNGLIATAPTSGENRFRKEWVEAFEGTTPYCVYDNDDAGEVGFRKVQKFFGGHIKRIILPTKDVTEYFLTHSFDEFSELVAEADIRYGMGV